MNNGMGESLIGMPVDRIDGVLKVTGSARYAGDFSLPGMLHAVMVTSTIPAGRIAAIDTAEAERMPGVRLVMTALNAPRLPNGGKAALQPPAGRALSLLQDTAVHYNNEPVAVVVADTLAQARDAARHVRPRYLPEQATLDFDAGKAAASKPKQAKDEPADTARGDFEPPRPTPPSARRPAPPCSCCPTARRWCVRARRTSAPAPTP